MKTIHKRVIAGAVALAVGALGASAFAADMSMCGQMEPMQGRGQRMAQMDPAKRAEHMKTRMDQRHAALRAKLKLTAEQEPAWKAFIAGAQPPMMGMQMDRAAMMKLPAPERMEKMQERMKEHQAFMTARLVELKKFYAVLTPEQKKIFDENTMGSRGGRHGGKGGGMAGGGAGGAHRHGSGPGAGSVPAPAAK